MPPEISLDELKFIAEGSRRSRYARQLMAGLCGAPELTVVLKESEEPPQVGDIPLRGTPTFHELADYIRRFAHADGHQAYECLDLEVVCWGNPCILHVLFKTVNGEKTITLRGEKDFSEQAEPGARALERVDVTYPAGSSSHEYDRKPLLAISEYQRRFDGVKWQVLFRFGLFLLALIGSWYCCSLLTHLLPSPWDWLLLAMAVCGMTMLLLYLLLKNLDRCHRRHGLCCPYCHSRLASDWGTFQARHRIAADLLEENPFLTGLCQHCKAEIIEPVAEGSG